MIEWIKKYRYKKAVDSVIEQMSNQSVTRIKVEEKNLTFECSDGKEIKIPNNPDYESIRFLIRLIQGIITEQAEIRKGMDDESDQ